MHRILIPIIGLLCVMHACSNDLTTIGQEIIGNDSYIGEESFPVSHTATIKTDSFVTSSGLGSQTYINKLVMGRYEDKYSGETVAIPCFQIAPSSSVPTLPDNAVLDSVIFKFSYAGDMWGDTLYNNAKPQTYDLYQLKELPEVDYDQYTVFYNTKAVDTNKILATTTFYPLVENMADAYFKIDDVGVKDLFDKMRAPRGHRDDLYYPETVNYMPFYNFLNHFKGLAIVPRETNTCMMTIHASDSLYLEFHYSLGGEDQRLRFPLAQRDLQFNRIINKPIKQLESLADSDKNEVLFDNLNEPFAITQGLSRYMIKLTLPDPPGYNQYRTIIKAQLEIKPEFTSNSPIPSPPLISVYTTNDINELTGSLYNFIDLTASPATGTAVEGVLVPDEIDPNDTRYIFDMTDYYQRVSAAPPAARSQQVVLSVPNAGYSTTSISFDQMVLRETPILRVYYAKYK